MMIGEQFRQACGDLLRKPPGMVRQFSGQQRFVQWQVHRQRRGIGAADRDPPSSDTAFVDIEAEDKVTIGRSERSKINRSALPDRMLIAVNSSSGNPPPGCVAETFRVL